jgi:hypothetical protein
MLRDVSVLAQFAVGLYVLSLIVWALVWFCIGYTLGETPDGPPRSIKVGFALFTCYPLVTTALGVSAWLCRSQGFEPVGIILTWLLIVASGSMLLPLFVWVLRVYVPALLRSR